MKRGGSAKLGMLTRESSLGKLREEERLRTLAKQDTRGKLIAAAQEREAREKATAGPKLITPKFAGELWGSMGIFWRCSRRRYNSLTFCPLVTSGHF